MTPTPADDRAALERLARARGVATSYVDVDGERQVASDDTLVGVLAALGEPLGRPSDAPAAAAERARRPGAARPPVVAWDGRLPPLRLGNRTAPRLELVPEGGAPARRLHAEVGGDGRATVPELLPHGVHELRDGRGGRRLCIVAPTTAPAIAAVAGPRPFGVFAPTYALHDSRDRAAGDLGTLERLGEVVAERGASVLATLPLLAELSAADGAGEGQKPYAPLSRLWWNEGYLDLARLPELAGDKGAGLVADAVTRAAAGAGGRVAHDGRRLADVAAASAAARPALEEAAGVLAASGGRRRDAFEAFAADRPDLDRYAAFRAAVEAAGPDLGRWPATWRAGRIEVSALPAASLARHRYAQFATDAQLGEVAGRLAGHGCGLLLDLPVGCGGGGYDPWAHPEAFATGASVGAPPDAFFTGGQNWGFPPPRPETDREAGYPLLRSVLARHAAHATVLRVDHVLGWRRLWWIPAGMAPAEGAYVGYPTDELLAIACLEASRHGCALVGEDLGTVPRGLRPALRRHGMAGMRVGVFDLEARPRARLRPPAGTVAYVDTHDTATFAAFATGADLDIRARLGLGGTTSLPEARADRRRGVTGLARRLVRSGLLAAGREDEPRAVLGAVLEELGRSEADLVVVTLEDLLGELEPQNVPGTTAEHDNFARCLAVGIDEVADDDEVSALLRRLGDARRAGSTGVAATTNG